MNLPWHDRGRARSRGRILDGARDLAAAGQSGRIAQLDARAAGVRCALPRRPCCATASCASCSTGAGTSAFIGECLAPALTRVRACASTRWRPRIWSVRPERSATAASAAAAGLLRALRQQSGERGGGQAGRAGVAGLPPPDRHLQREGALYRRRAELRNAHVVLLPEETHDRGFAMTSSFTGMLLAAALPSTCCPRMPSPAQWRALGSADAAAPRLPLCRELAHAGFERVVYLGSNGAQKAWRAKRRSRLLGTYRRPRGRACPKRRWVSPRAQDHRQRQDSGGDVSGNRSARAALRARSAPRAARATAWPRA